MTDKRSKTTGLPVSSKRMTDGRRRKSRSERESEMNRLVLIISGVLAGVLVLILGIALLIDTVIRPNQPVATVGGQNISVREFQKRVIYERRTGGQQLAAIFNAYGDFAQQLVGDQNSPYGQLYSELQQPVLMGNAVLEKMVQARLIQQYADANGIKVTPAEIDAEVFKAFGYQPVPMTNTPTTTPSTTPTPLVSATPTSTPTVTPVPSMTMTPTTTPFPTGVPTATPGPTEQKQSYDKNSKTYFDSITKESGLSVDDIRAIFAESILRKKVEEAVVGKAPDKEDQIKARHILVNTEDEGKNVLTALQQGESFSALAKSVSKDTGSGASGGELGWKGKGTYVAEFEAAIWAGKAGDVVGPIKTQFGYHIIQIEAHEMRTLTDAEKTQVQDKLFNDWITKQKTDKNAQTFSNWTDRVPSNPSLSDLGLPTSLSGANNGFGG